MRLAFAFLLFSSPLALHQTIAQRAVDNIFSSYTNFSFYASDAFLLLILALWLLSLIVQPRHIRTGPWFMTWPIAGLVVLSWTGVITGIDPTLTAYHSVRFALLLGLYLFLVNERPSPEWVAIPLASGLILEVLMSFAQFLAQRSVGLGAIGELTVDPNSPGASILRIGETRVLRAYGLTEHPNLLGGFFAFGLVLLLGWFIFSSHTRQSKFLQLATLALAVVGLLLTFSRAAAFAFLSGSGLIGLVCLYLEVGRRERILHFGIAGIIMFAAVAIPILANRQLVAVRIDQGNSFADNSNEQRSLAEREALIASAYRVLSGHELIGVGNGALPLAMYKLDGQFQKQYDYQPAHLILLDAAAELGVPGGALWLWLLVAPLVAFYSHRHEVATNPWLAPATAVLLLFGIIGFFDYYPWLSSAGRLWQWSAWGLFSAAYQIRGDSLECSN